MGAGVIEFYGMVKE